MFQSLPKILKIQNLENWIAQKRAEIAKEKAVLENKENVPTATVRSGSMPPPVAKQKNNASPLGVYAN